MATASNTSASLTIDPSRPIVLLYGAAQRLIDRAIHAIIAQQVGSDDEYAVTTLRAAEDDVGRMIEELSSFSLMALQRVVVLKDVDKLDAEEQEQLAEALTRLGAGVTVVLTAGEGKGRTPPVEAALRKVIRKLGQAHRLAAPQGDRLVWWVREEAKRQGLVLSNRVAEELVARAGTDLDTLASEIEKLAIYVGDRGEATAADIEAVVCTTAESSIFDLVDAIGQRQAGKALSILNSLLPPRVGLQDALPLLGMIARQFRLIWQARVVPDARKASGSAGRGQGATSQRIAECLPRQHNYYDAIKRHDFLDRKYRSQARKFTHTQLARALVSIYETDRALKGQTEEQLDMRTTLELLVVKLCGPQEVTR